MSNKQLARVLQETVDVVKEINTKFNPRHESSSGRFASGGGGGGAGGGGSGSSGRSGTSPGGKESYNDRIEGTQKEADREVTRALKAEGKARKAVKAAETRLAVHDKGKAAAKAKVKVISSKLTEVRSKVAKFKKLKEESEARIAALRAQLKKGKVEQQLDKEIKTLKGIANKFKKVADDFEIIAKEASKL